MLQAMGSQRVRHDWVTEQQQEGQQRAPSLPVCTQRRGYVRTEAGRQPSANQEESSGQKPSPAEP